MTETFLDGRVTLHCGDSFEILKAQPDCSVDSIVTDPPYALVSIVKRFANSPRNERTENTENPYGRTGRGFMGKRWDTGETAFAVEFWEQCLRVLKPGGHVVAFGGTRTYHRLACAIEDAGFEIRDMVSWTYGSGFPKSHDVSKGIDRAAGAERAVVSTGSPVKRMIPGADQNKAGWEKNNGREYVPSVTAAATADAAQWEGWGTALKPAVEPICLARKPLGSPAIDVRGNIENQLRELGVTGDIQWTGSAFIAKKSRRRSGSDTTQRSEHLQTPAKTVGASSPPSIEKKIEKLTDQPLSDGLLATVTEQENFLEKQIGGLENRSSPHTATNASAATRRKSRSSQSTTSTAVGQNTGNSDTKKYTQNSDDLTIPEDTASFAGIVTGLTGSQARVLIKRASDGLFVWPDGVPAFVAPQSLTVAENVLQHGVGALNIDGCRIHAEDAKGYEYTVARTMPGAGQNKTGERKQDGITFTGQTKDGRWPANLVHDGSEEVIAAFPVVGDAHAPNNEGSIRSNQVFGADLKPREFHAGFSDSGSAARFFYTAKADADDRIGSKHPTVKPVDLMQWLVRLVTPKGGLILDPFAGTGTTAEAAFREGMRCVLVEREAEYQDCIRRRMRLALAGPEERKRESIKAKMKDQPIDAGPLFATSG